MKTCSKCGAIIRSDSSPDGDGSLKPLEELAGLGDVDKKRGLFCERCREEKRLTGAALLDTFGD